jgi:hypothetical protein
MEPPGHSVSTGNTDAQARGEYLRRLPARELERYAPVTCSIGRLALAGRPYKALAHHEDERLTHQTAGSPDPLWMSQLEWPVIIHELGLGHPMKFIWEERAKALITYPNFWKHFLSLIG